MKKSVPLYMISDSVGETSLKLVNAVTAQFPTVEFDLSYRFPFTKDEKELHNILSDALKDGAVVVTTLVSENLTKIVEDFGERTGLQYINLMSSFMDIIYQKSGVAPMRKAGVVHLQRFENKVVGELLDIFAGFELQNVAQQGVSQIRVLRLHAGRAAERG